MRTCLPIPTHTSAPARSPPLPLIVPPRGRDVSPLVPVARAGAAGVAVAVVVAVVAVAMAVMEMLSATLVVVAVAVAALASAERRPILLPAGTLALDLGEVFAYSRLIKIVLAVQICNISRK